MGNHFSIMDSLYLGLKRNMIGVEYGTQKVVYIQKIIHNLNMMEKFFLNNTKKVVFVHRVKNVIEDGKEDNQIEQPDE